MTNEQSVEEENDINNKVEFLIEDKLGREIQNQIPLLPVIERNNSSVIMSLVNNDLREFESMLQTRDKMTNAERQKKYRDKINLKTHSMLQKVKSIPILLNIGFLLCLFLSR